MGRAKGILLRLKPQDWEALDAIRRPDEVGPQDTLRRLIYEALARADPAQAAEHETKELSEADLAAIARARANQATGDGG